LSEGYLTLARDIEVMEPKSPEDIYKVHLIDGRGATSSSLDSARQNLAATFVNAFVNAGFGQVSYANFIKGFQGKQGSQHSCCRINS
jgi:26S proteasome regulatory subunit N1